MFLPAREAAFHRSTGIVSDDHQRLEVGHHHCRPAHRASHTPLDLLAQENRSRPPLHALIQFSWIITRRCRALGIDDAQTIGRTTADEPRQVTASVMSTSC